MPTASISAQIADLLGEPLIEDPRRPRRLLVADAVAQCEPGQVLPAQNETGQQVAVAVTGAGKIYIVTDTCPHDGGPLSTGFVDGERLVCARHGWEFDLATGRCPRREACVKSKQLGS